MSRNLISRLRQAPNPANVPPAQVGEWTELNDPAALAHLDFGPPGEHLRQRVQSIPSPWARMLLFRNALEEDGHPARALVCSELLDAFELLWSLPSFATVNPVFQTIKIDELEGFAKATGSQRVERFARALLELLPRHDKAGTTPAFTSIAILLIDGRPVLATSPFTGVFTAEDAASKKTGPLFRYATGEAYRPLSTRSPDFQRYVARVVLPQLDDAGPAHSMMVALLRPWLTSEVRQAAAETSNATSLSAPGSWRSAAEQLGLTELDSFPSTPRLFSRAAGAQLASSKWRLLSKRAAGSLPLVIDKNSFDGVYYTGATPVTLPHDIKGLDRGTLPGSGVSYPWISPADDWFADSVLILRGALVRENVRGFEKFKTVYQGDKAYLKSPHFTVPLRSEVLKYFSADDLSEMLSIECRNDGSIVAALRLRLGDDDNPQQLTVSRRYDETAIQNADGPAVTVWPRFASPQWQTYTALRDDVSPATSQLLELRAAAGGRELEARAQRRTPTSTVYSYGAAPEGFEFVATHGSSNARHFGMLLPHYSRAHATIAGTMKVGVDFGTSNTVVSLRASSASAPEILGIDELTLPLTERSVESERRAEAYFMPHSLARSPFGTAVMRFNALPSLNLMTEPLGVRVNIPFSGVVESDSDNRVVGDLKWSADKEGLFLTAAFIRHLLVVVAAEAAQRGIRPDVVEIIWSHPRSFTQHQVNQLRGLWNQARESLAEFGISVGNVTEAVDESRAVLRHFFNAGQLGVSGSASAIIDIGGGTSDIAVYGQGRTILLDSVMLGGRNLTGARMQGATAQALANPFVRSMVSWSAGHQLADYPVEKRAIDKYLADGQDHLAFSYLLQTKWFRQQGHGFIDDPSAHRFQQLVLYFFGGLSYYLGLALRSTGNVPSRVMLAGNGSQYLHWLSDLQPSGNELFTRALGRLVIAGMGQVADNQIPKLELTTTPKREVASGLVAAVNAQLDESTALQESVVGENVSLPAKDGRKAKLGADERLPTHLLLEAGDASGIVWADGTSELEKFHIALAAETRTFAAFGTHWQMTSQSLDQFFAALSSRDIQDLARHRLHYLAESHGGFHGSLFILEVAAVLDRMLGQSFTSNQ